MLFRLLQSYQPIQQSYSYYTCISLSNAKHCKIWKRPLNIMGLSAIASKEKYLIEKEKQQQLVFWKITESLSRNRQKSKYLLQFCFGESQHCAKQCTHNKTFHFKLCNWVLLSKHKHESVFLLCPHNHLTTNQSHSALLKARLSNVTVLLGIYYRFPEMFCYTCGSIGHVNTGCSHMQRSLFVSFSELKW